MAQVVVAHAEAGMRELLVELLTEAGHQVIAVPHGEAAWQLLSTATSSRVAVLERAFDLQAKSGRGRHV